MKILCVSLGCDKNLVDSEVMLGLLSDRGYGFTDDEEEADVIIVNTCCFIGDAKEESVNTILQLAEYKKEGSAKALVVTGCLAERYRQEILEVDAVLGTTAYDQIGEVLQKALEGKQQLLCQDLNRLVVSDTKRILTTGGHYAYLKIAEGCDKRCTYCIIPKLRGSYRSFGISYQRSTGAGRAGGKRADFGGAGDNPVWGGSLWREKSAQTFKSPLQDPGNPVDPGAVLLSGGDL